MKDLVIENLKKEIEGYKREIRTEKIGHVLEVGDGIVRISGLGEIGAQEMIEFESSSSAPKSISLRQNSVWGGAGAIRGIAFNLEEDSVGAILLGDCTAVKEGDIAKPTGRVLSIRVGEELIGRVIDPLGNPLDDRGPIFQDADQRGGVKAQKPKFYPIERLAPSVVAREPVNTPLHTGIKAIDSMIPIGRGQRELIIGDRQIGKTSIVVDTIINQGREISSERAADNYLAVRPVICIYVAIGQKESKIAKIAATLKEYGAMDYTIIVSAPASSPASLWYLAPYAGCAIGEYFMEQGRDALVIYDDLSKHAWAYRELSLLLRRPPGREAYPGDVFYLHSRLLERAAKLNKENGGGSLTALPIIETQLGDISAYIPTNVISITDGQIYLEPELFFQGVRPAINVGLSVSRVGSAAQTKAMKKVAGRLRLELAQYRELAAFVQFASELDEATQKRIARGRALTELLKQPELEPMPFEEEVCLIWAGINGYFDDVPPAEIAARGEKFLEYLEKLHRDTILEKIKTSGELSEATEANLKKAIEEFKKL